MYQRLLPYFPLPASTSLSLDSLIAVRYPRDEADDLSGGPLLLVSTSLLVLGHPRNTPIIESVIG